MKKKAATSFDLALQYLGYRSRTEAEVRAYLEKKGIESEETEDVISKLMYYHYIDDVQYLRTMVSSNYNGSQFGRRRLRMDLKRRGIQEDTLSQLDLFFTDSMEEDCLKSQFSTACRKYQNEPMIKRKQKINVFLQRRGFSYDSIASMINGYPFEQKNPDFEEDFSFDDLKYYYEKYYRIYSRKGFTGRELIVRVCRGLLSRGFSYDDVEQAVSLYQEN